MRRGRVDRSGRRRTAAGTRPAPAAAETCYRDEMPTDAGSATSGTRRTGACEACCCSSLLAHPTRPPAASTVAPVCQPTQASPPCIHHRVTKNTSSVNAVVLRKHVATFGPKRTSQVGGGWGRKLSRQVQTSPSRPDSAGSYALHGHSRGRCKFSMGLSLGWPLSGYSILRFLQIFSRI